MDGYVDKVITKEIFENEIKTHKDYDYSYLMSSEFNYECPMCGSCSNG